MNEEQRLACHTMQQIVKHKCLFKLFVSTLILKGMMSLSIENTNMRQKAAVDIMKQFSKRTGLLQADTKKDETTYDERINRRYLWTDSFALCNYIGFSRYCSKIGDENGKEYNEMLCYKLIENVHDKLGRFRSDDKNLERRMKWISGLSEEEGKLHPTKGGLRIGKAMVERDESEPYDDRLEWDRDGQYFHYLTKWIFALDQMARYSNDPIYNVWAEEMAVTATQKFTYKPSKGYKGYRMYWKMSTDLSRPLVSSMGASDPLGNSLSILP